MFTSIETDFLRRQCDCQNRSLLINANDISTELKNELADEALIEGGESSLQSAVFRRRCISWMFLIKTTSERRQPHSPIFFYSTLE